MNNAFINQELELAAKRTLTRITGSEDTLKPLYLQPDRALFLAEKLRSSTNGGSSWGTPTMLAGPMTLTSLPLTTQGYMVGDYISTSFNGSGTAHGVFAVGLVVTGKTCTLGDVTSCNEAMYTNASGLAALAGSRVSNDHAVASSQGSSHLSTAR